MLSYHFPEEILIARTCKIDRYIPGRASYGRSHEKRLSLYLSLCMCIILKQASKASLSRYMYLCCSIVGGASRTFICEWRLVDNFGLADGRARRRAGPLDLGLKRQQGGGKVSVRQVGRNLLSGLILWHCCLPIDKNVRR